MSTSTEATTETGVRLADWQAGVVGGIAGAALMAVLVSLMNAAVLQGAIPALYGLSGGVAGWVIHLSHGAILGVVLAALIEHVYPGEHGGDRRGAWSPLGRPHVDWPRRARDAAVALGCRLPDGSAVPELRPPEPVVARRLRRRAGRWVRCTAVADCMPAGGPVTWPCLLSGVRGRPPPPVRPRGPRTRRRRRTGRASRRRSRARTRRSRTSRR